MKRVCSFISSLWFSFAIIACSENNLATDSAHVWSFKPSEVSVSAVTIEHDSVESLRAIDTDNLIVAMNGGIFGKDFKPLGILYDKKALYPINLSEGAGNFYMKPNGVFYLKGDTAGILETNQFRETIKAYDFAVQSGPLLLNQGKIHPSFKSTSSSEYIRNGIGVDSDGVVHLVYFPVPCNLHSMANYFKELGCNNALYLDGAISGVVSPQISERLGQKFGSIIVVRPK